MYTNSIAILLTSILVFTATFYSVCKAPYMKCYDMFSYTHIASLHYI